MKHLPTLLLAAAILLLLPCCHGSDATESKAVEKAVLLSYAALLDGRYSDYSDSLAGAAKRSGEYNAQLAAGAAMYIEQQHATHRGIVDVRVADVEMEDNPMQANAYVVLCYADTTNEEIVVPMCKENGIWKVR